MLPDLAQIYDDHGPALYAFLLNFTRSEADACDSLQDVFARLAARPSLLAGVRELRPWLVKMCHRQALDTFRRRDARARTAAAAAEDAPLFAPAENADADAFAASVAAAMAELPEEQRAVVHLKIWEAMTFAQIAEALGLSANTAASRYRYALDKLGARLRPLYEPQTP